MADVKYLVLGPEESCTGDPARRAGNEFLFDVVKDPRERANLRDRYKDVFDRLKNDWAGWNETMLAERPRPGNYSQPGNLLADHYGVVNPPPPPAAAR